MALAAEGLPSAGGGGYELLDSLTGFGTTSQMFDAAYWRAKEGELARTILAVPEVKTARVHISQAPGSPLRRIRTADRQRHRHHGRPGRWTNRRPGAETSGGQRGRRHAPRGCADHRHRGRPDRGRRRRPRRRHCGLGPRRRDSPQRAAPARGARGRRQGGGRGLAGHHHRARADHRAAVRPAGSGRDLDRDRGTQRQRHQARRRCHRGLEPARGRCRRRAATASRKIQRNARAGELRGLGNAARIAARPGRHPADDRRRADRRRVVPPRTAPRPGRRAATRNWRRCANWSPRPSAWTRRGATC
jgi:hypothetical protein